MAETVYDVKVRYMTDDRASRGLRGIEQAARGAGKESDSLSKTLMRVGAGVAAWKGFSLGKSLLIDFNSQIEQATISMSGLMMMNQGGTFAENQRKANALIEQFQQDAKASTATTADFVAMASNITAPLTQAGASMKDLREVTKGAVVAAGAFGISGEMAGLDIQQALAGTLSSKDRFAKLLGLDPESWNKMVRDNPAAAIPGLLKVFNQPAIKQMAEAQANTFAGQWSTLKDNMQIALGKVGLPLMKELGKEFARISQWMDNNPERVNEIAREIASALVTGFKAVRDAMKFLYDNRETIMILAKAFLAFKATNYVVSGVQNLANSISVFAKSSDIAAKGMAGFAGKLPGIAAGLAAVHGIAQGIADKIVDDAIQEMESRENVSFQSERARFLGSDKVGSIDFMRYQQLQRSARQRGYTDDTGAKMFSDASARSRAERLKQSRAGVFTAADKLMGASVLDAMTRQAGIKEGMTGARKLTVGDVARMQGVTSGNHGTIQALLGAARAQGYTGDAGSLMQMNPQELVNMIGSNIDKLWKDLGDTRGGDDFLGALEGVSNALKMHAGLLDKLESNSAWETRMKGISESVNSGLTSFAAWVGEGANKAASAQRNTNVTIRKIEVVSDDPDRFAMNLVGAFQDYNKSPTQAVNAINER